MYLDDHMSCSCILLTKCSMFNSSAVFLAGSITCITSAWIVAAVFCPEEMVRTIFAGRSRGDLRTITLSDRASFWISVAWKRSEHVWSAIGEFRDVLREQPAGAGNAIMS